MSRSATVFQRSAGPTKATLVSSTAGPKSAPTLPAIVKELLGFGVIILVTAGTPAALAATRANATIPIVLIGVDDPVSLGLVDTLTHPGGNITGLSLTSSEVIAERLEVLRQLVLGLHRLAVMVRDDPGLDQKFHDIRSNVERKGIKALMLKATTGRAMDLAFARLQSDRTEAIYVASGPLGPVKRARIIALAAEARLPAIYSSRIFAIEGGLISFAADYGDLFPRAAIPQAMLARADEVIDKATESDPCLTLLPIRQCDHGQL